MKEGPDISRIAALIGDPARANILTALMAGKALTATELAAEAARNATALPEHIKPEVGIPCLCCARYVRAPLFSSA